MNENNNKNILHIITAYTRTQIQMSLFCFVFSLCAFVYILCQRSIRYFISESYFFRNIQRNRNAWQILDQRRQFFAL